VIRPVVLASVVLLGAAAGTACSTQLGGPANPYEVSIDAVRHAAETGGDTGGCALDVDVPTAFRDAGVPDARFGAGSSSASFRDEPMPDPIAAERKGMSAMEATAGALIECDYSAGGSEVSLYLAVTRTKGALRVLGPVIARSAHLERTELPRYVSPPPKPGDVKRMGDVAAVAGVAAVGGDAALVVTSTVADLPIAAVADRTARRLGFF
jgi:hypothetical protein